MTDILLRELSNDDIDWMLGTGETKEIPANTVIFEQGTPVKAFYILLDGTLSVYAVPIANRSSDECQLFQLSSGEMVGEFPLLKNSYSTTNVKAIEKSSILSVPLWSLGVKLQKDINFAAHLYRAIAILLADRLHKTINQLAKTVGQNIAQIAQYQQRKMFFIFAELQDSDIDWLVGAGTLERIPAGTVIINAGRPADALHILLDGKLGLTPCEDNINPWMRAKTQSQNKETQPNTFAIISKGDIFGETPFVEASPSSITIKALVNSLVLSIPRWRLAAKLLHDIGFAIRFYRVLAILFADKQQAVISQITSQITSHSDYNKPQYNINNFLDEDNNLENELNADTLLQMSLAANRFDWMLKKIQQG
jgi:bacteriocin-type transport-associated protein